MNPLNPLNPPTQLTPLAGCTVLDFSRLLPGPYLTRLLADLGAAVIKIEDPAGDLTRHMPPFGRSGIGAAFTALNVGKRSVVLDLKRPHGVDLALALAARADVLVESFRPGVLDRLGLGASTLLQRNPRLVVCSISGYGQSGPARDLAGHDLNYLARTGLLELFGPSDAPPVAPGVQIADIAGGALSAAVGVLAALLERQRTGKGQHLDISMSRAVMGLAAMELARRGAGGGAPEPRGAGLLTGGRPCYRVYATRDGRHMALAALEPKFFAAFCERAGCANLAGAGLATGDEGTRVLAKLEALFASRTQAQWVEVLRGANCCCEPVRTLEEALQDPELPDLARCAAQVDGVPVFFPDVGGGGGGGGGGALLRTASSRALPAPAQLGADGPDVMREFELDEDLVAAATASGALMAARAT